MGALCDIKKTDDFSGDTCIKKYYGIKEINDGSDLLYHNIIKEDNKCNDIKGSNKIFPHYVSNIPVEIDNIKTCLENIPYSEEEHLSDDINYSNKLTILQEQHQNLCLLNSTTVENILYPLYLMNPADRSALDNNNLYDVFNDSEWDKHYSSLISSSKFPSDIAEYKNIDCKIYPKKSIDD